MKTQRNILIAFLLNLSFAVFEFIGGIFTGSVAILSDAVHDIGDATSIGASYFLEKKSKKQPDEAYNYGYARYSVIGSVITTLILLVGSVLVVYNAVNRILNPVEINSYSSDELREIISSRVEASGDVWKTGICCVNMDSEVRDERVDEIYQIAETLR